MAQQTTVWGLHASRTGDIDQQFLDGGFVAVGWAKLGDLRRLGDRESFKSALQQAYPEKKAGAIPNNAGQLYRFAHEMAVDDLVVFPTKADRQVHIGVVTGGYLHDATRDEPYPHRRAVRWLRSVPRTQFSQGALYELGSALSLFQIKSYADEFRAALEGQTPAPPVEEDETVAVVAEDAWESTRDFVLKHLARSTKGHPFSHVVANLLNTMGYRTRVSPEGPDGGIDIIAHKDELGFEPPIVKVQVKSTEGSVGDPVVSALSGKVQSGEYGLLVTLGTFTTQAKTFARGRSNLRLIDGSELVDLVLDKYEQLDAKYKAIIPLRKVWLPQPVEDDGED